MRNDLDQELIDPNVSVEKKHDLITRSLERLTNLDPKIKKAILISTMVAAGLVSVAYLTPAILSTMQLYNMGFAAGNAGIGGTYIAQKIGFGTYELISNTPIIGSAFKPATVAAMAMAPKIAASIGAGFGLITTGLAIKYNEIRKRSKNN